MDLPKKEHIIDQADARYPRPLPIPNHNTIVEQQVIGDVTLYIISVNLVYILSSGPQFGPIYEYRLGNYIKPRYIIKAIVKPNGKDIRKLIYEALLTNIIYKNLNLCKAEYIDIIDKLKDKTLSITYNKH